MILSIVQRQLHVVALVSVLIWASGCASSSPPPVSDTPAPESMAPALIVADDGGLALQAISSGASRRLEADLSFAGLYRPAHRDRDAVVTLKRNHQTELGLLSSDGTFEPVHRTDGSAEYSVAWSDDGDLAFGFQGASKGIGIFTHQGSLLDVGCSASSRVLSWAAEDRLVVADANNHYVVSSNGCATLKRIDARKMHEDAYNPENQTVAYVFRELEYDRNARQYVPDSSLWIADVYGAEPEMIVGDRYKPHRPAWSPSGTELAFDARLPDQPNRRLISIFDVEQATSAFLNPSLVDAPVSEWDPHWSPSGVNIVYRQQYDEVEPGIVVRPMNGSFISLVGESGEHFVRWIDDNHLVLSNGTVERLVSIDGTVSAEAKPGAAILGLH